METRRPSMPTSIGSSTSRVIPPPAPPTPLAPPLYAGLCRLIDLEGDPAHGVHDVLNAAKVHNHVAVDGNAGKVLDRLDGKVGTTGGEGGVDLVLPHARYVHERVPRDGEHPPARGRHDAGVGARSPARRRVLGSAAAR